MLTVIQQAWQLHSLVLVVPTFDFPTFDVSQSGDGRLRSKMPFFQDSHDL